MILPRSLLSPPWPPRKHASSCSISWGSATSTGASSGASAPSRPPSWPSPRPRSTSIGPTRHKTPSDPRARPAVHCGGGRIRCGSRGGLLPAFFHRPEDPPQRLSLPPSNTRRNYDIGNREFLAGKLALEEWRHWLEGTKVPFLVWTDHRNIKYIRSAKRLNSRKASWSLFFDRFNFTLSYRPGSRNLKPEALPRQFPECPDETVKPSTIIRASCLVASSPGR